MMWIDRWLEPLFIIGIFYDFIILWSVAYSKALSINMKFPSNTGCCNENQESHNVVLLAVNYNHCFGSKLNWYWQVVLILCHSLLIIYLMLNNSNNSYYCYQYYCCCYYTGHIGQIMLCKCNIIFTGMSWTNQQMLLLVLYRRRFFLF